MKSKAKDGKKCTVLRKMVSGSVHTIDAGNYCRILPGDELQTTNPYSQQDCLYIEKELRKVGFLTKLAQHNETKQWFIKILSKEIEERV